MARNLSFTEEGLVTLVEALLLARSCYEQRIQGILLEEAHVTTEAKKRIRRFRERVSIIDNLIRHVESKLPRQS